MSDVGQFGYVIAVVIVLLRLVTDIAVVVTVIVTPVAVFVVVVVPFTGWPFKFCSDQFLGQVRSIIIRL